MRECDKTDLVWQHWFEAAAEIAEAVSVLMDLHTFSIILDLRVHPIRAFLHCILDGFTSLCLKSQRKFQSSHQVTKFLCIFKFHLKIFLVAPVAKVYLTSMENFQVKADSDIN